MTKPNKKNTAKVKTVKIPEAELANLVQSVGTLLMMHMNLIGYYKEESELKKHHRAYLHVRDEAEDVIKSDLEQIETMLTSIGGFLMTGNSPFAPNDGVPFDCEVTPIPHCECEKCAEEKEDDDPCVIMRLTDLQAMQEDMINLTDSIDLLTKYYIATKYGAPVNKQHYDNAVHETKDLADQVFRRWENSTLEEIK